METKTYHCEQCPMRSKYDQNSKSLIGRFWRWHINFCPGWKEYFNSLSTEKQTELKIKYKLK